jgi:hypothetical protein
VVPTREPAVRRVQWWTAILFMIGSACFALGAMPGYAALVGFEPDSMTFFVGSIFFTSAALLQYRLSVDHTWVPRSSDAAAALVQFVGTLFFNRSTFNALSSNLGTATADQTVWRPDAWGSIAFLIASALAFLSVPDNRWWNTGNEAWRINAWNMVGSIFFAASAVASYVVPATGSLRNAQLTNTGTFLGAVCFFVGAWLLRPRHEAAVG